MSAVHHSRNLDLLGAQFVHGTMVNPLTRCVEDYALPPFAELRVSDIVPAVRTAIAELALDLNAIEDDLSCEDAEIEWESVMDRLEIIDDPLARLWNIVAHLGTVSNSPELREAKAEVQAEVLAIQSRRRQSVDIFRAMEALRASPEAEHFTTEQKRLLDREIVEATLNGVALSGPAKEQFNAIDVRLQELIAIFEGNLIDEINTFEIIVTDKSELEGISDSVLSLLAQNTVAAGYADATTADGPWKLSLDMPSYSPVMSQCTNRALREKLYRANATRSGTGPYDNTPVLIEILHLRHEKAYLLGYSTFAECRLVDRMAPSVAAVEAMLEELRKKCYPKAQAELKSLKELAAQHGHPTPLELWDVPYWTEQYRQQQHELDAEELKQYFPLHKVLKGLFELSEELFGIRVEAADGEEETWHPDVRFFNFRALEQPGEPIIAQFYLDPYTRPGEKIEGGVFAAIASRSKTLRTEKAPVRRPVFSLTMNQTPPVGDTPSLMSFQDVEYLFHMFGYGLQVALTTADYTAASREGAIEWDAIEVPSLFFVNFVYRRGTQIHGQMNIHRTVDTFQRISGHYATGEPLPDETLDRLIASRQVMPATKLLGLLCKAARDMALHQHYDPLSAAETVFDVERRRIEKFTVIPPLPDDKFICSFTHVFISGYEAAYYSYIWSEMLSADAYLRFEEAADEQELRRIGREFRDTIFALLGIEHPMTAFKMFQGRLPSTRALLKQYGLDR
ncbi:hypothetical protein AC1031_019421 [Aphanomyces cochlioides]|nr:hypothetical protein AC1031_019421 [Aphanomyces cochlioides]